MCVCVFWILDDLRWFDKVAALEFFASVRRCLLRVDCQKSSRRLIMLPFQTLLAPVFRGIPAPARALLAPWRSHSLRHPSLSRPWSPSTWEQLLPPQRPAALASSWLQGFAVLRLRLAWPPTANVQRRRRPGTLPRPSCPPWRGSARTIQKLKWLINFSIYGFLKTLKKPQVFFDFVSQGGWNK